MPRIGLGNEKPDADTPGVVEKETRMSSTENILIPGGYKTAAEALADLARLASVEQAMMNANQRLQAALISLERLLRQARMDRAVALNAVNIFAELAPLQLGLVSSAVADARLDVDATLTVLEQEVIEIARSVGGSDL